MHAFYNTEDFFASHAVDLGRQQIVLPKYRSHEILSACISLEVLS